MELSFYGELLDLFKFYLAGTNSENKHVLSNAIKVLGTNFERLALELSRKILNHTNL